MEKQNNQVGSFFRIFPPTPSTFQKNAEMPRVGVKEGGDKGTKMTDRRLKDAKTTKSMQLLSYYGAIP